MEISTCNEEKEILKKIIIFKKLFDCKRKIIITIGKF